MPVRAPLSPPRVPLVVAATALAALAVTTVMACHALEPSSKPINACMKSCTTRASRECSEAECARGCEFILDRIVEKEMNNVIACVARTPRRCTDVVWAECAAHVGVHADGGPPPPPPPTEYE